MISKTIFSSVGLRYRKCFGRSTGVLKCNSSNGFKLWSLLRYPLVPFKLTDIGEGIKEVTVKQCFVKANQKLSQFEDVCEVESDKASVTITSRFDGHVKRVYFKEGDVIPVGSTLLDIETAETDQEEVAEEVTFATVPEDERANEKAEKVECTRVEIRATDTAEQLHAQKALATPAVRRIAKEYNVDINTLNGSGKDGRVVKEDILVHLNRPCTTPPPSVTASEDSSERIAGYRKVMVRTMTESNRIPTLTLSEEINVTSLEALRKDVKAHLEKEQIKLTLLAFLVKAVSLALEQYPVLNATLEGETIRYISSHNIGIAVDTDAGLVVPNIKNVQRLSIRTIAKELQRLQQLAVRHELSLADTANGTFTISNIGSIAGTVVKPLILPPQVAIVGIGRMRKVPRYNENDEIEKSLIINASWAADHRIIDGGTIARFSNVVKRYFENPVLLIVDA